MLVEYPILFSALSQQLLLVMTVTLLIVILAATQLADIEWLPDARKHLQEFLPLIVVLLIVLSSGVIRYLTR
jgi:hypothetical protein